MCYSKLMSYCEGVEWPTKNEVSLWMISWATLKQHFFLKRKRLYLDKEKVRSRMLKKTYWHIKQIGSLTSQISHCYGSQLKVPKVIQRSWFGAQGVLLHDMCTNFTISRGETNVGKITSFSLVSFSKYYSKHVCMYGWIYY